VTETRLRRATGIHEQFFYDVRTEPGVAAASLSPPPSRQEHAIWYAQQGAIPRIGAPRTAALFVVEGRAVGEPWTPIGTARIQPVPHRAGITAWISIALLPAARGQHHGARTLGLLYTEAEAWGCTDLSGWILPTNEVSLRCFTKAGYQLVGHDGIMLATRMVQAA
jgi:RimJ/RimL family protein N-acetyltransferase